MTIENFCKLFYEIFKVEAKLLSQVLILREGYTLFLLRRSTQQLLMSDILIY